MIPPDTDVKLMLRLQQGDESAFEELVDRHKQRVFGIVYRFLGGASDAEDVAQEVFLRVYRARLSYVPSAQFTTWLFTLCKNTCLKELRKRRSDTVSLSTGRTDDEAPPELADERTPSPAEAALREEQAEAVRKALETLPESQKMALILFKYEQLSHEEIAHTLGCSVRAVKSLLHRGKVKLRKELAPYVCES